jgi:hypothetical protein
MTCDVWGPPCAARLSLIAALSLRPDIVVNSPGTQATATGPMSASCVDTTRGCHSNGKSIFPKEKSFVKYKNKLRARGNVVVKALCYKLDQRTAYQILAHFSPYNSCLYVLVCKLPFPAVSQGFRTQYLQRSATEHFSTSHP